MSAGLRHCWTYFVWTLPNITNLLEPLERAITEVLIPALTDHQVTGDERALLALPVRIGGLGLGLGPVESSPLECEASITATGPLVQHIVTQEHQPPDQADMLAEKQHGGTEQEKPAPKGYRS